jgi:hypothetical protein
MKKYFGPFCFILFSIAFLGFSQAQAGQVLEVKIACPDTVKVGDPLVVTVVSILNDDFENSVSISKALVGFGGNMGNSVSGIGLFGPFSRDLTWSVGPGGTLSNPGTISIISRVPASLAGKVAVATVVFTTVDYKKHLGSDGCGVNVIK